MATTTIPYRVVRERFLRRLVFPDSEYDVERRLWNAIRGGGHAVDGKALADHALAIDLELHELAVVFVLAHVGRLERAAAPAAAPGSVASPRMAVMVRGGAIDDVPDDAMAFYRTDAAYWWEAATMWLDPAQDDLWIPWCRDAAARHQPYASAGSYINLTVEPAGGLRQAFGPDKYARLVELKNRWDPDNFLRFNKNILPTVRQRRPRWLAFS